MAAWVREDLQKSDNVVAELVSLLNEDILVTVLRSKGLRLPKKTGGTELAIFVEAYGGANDGARETNDHLQQV